MDILFTLQHLKVLTSKGVVISHLKESYYADNWKGGGRIKK